MDQHSPLQSRPSVLSFNHEFTRAESVKLHGFQQKRAFRRKGLKTLEVTYLKFASEGNVTIVEKIFKKYTEDQLNRDCTDYFERTALVLAITNRHQQMVEFLLKNRVKLTESLFYAIETEFTEAVEAILRSDAFTQTMHQDMLITSEESIFPRFLSPMMLAAHKNNYEILEILYSHGHRLRDYSCSAGNKWDQIRLRWLFYKARASQAHMVLMYNKENIDPLNEAIEFHGQLKNEGLKSREVRGNYKELAKQCEDFAIALLDQLRTAQELADLLRFCLVDRDFRNTNELAFRTLPAMLTPSRLQKDLSNPKLNGSLVSQDENFDWVNSNLAQLPEINVIEPLDDDGKGSSNFTAPTKTDDRNVADVIRKKTVHGTLSQPHSTTQSPQRAPISGSAISAIDEADNRRVSLAMENVPEDRHRTLGMRRRKATYGELEFARPIHFLKPIERAVDNGMVRLVTCENSQLALSYLKDGLLFRDMSNPKLFLKKFLVGLFFPVISIAFLLFPNSKLGVIARNPTAKLWMEAASDVYLVLIMLGNLVLTSTGVIDTRTFSPFLIAAYFWMPGKFCNLIFLTYHQRWRVVYSIWNWNDIVSIALYTAFIIVRSYVALLGDSDAFEAKSQWSAIPLCDMMISVVYILVFLRPLEMLRVNRMFGPLQISVDRMMTDVLKFFMIFLVIWFAFSSGINSLLWRYREMNGNETLNCDEVDSFANFDGCCWNEDQFTDLGSSLRVHFWSIFGYSDNYMSWFTLSCDNGVIRDYTMAFGEIEFALYHFGTVIVLVNMLIAIMSGTLQKTVDDSDIQWQYHRTRVWIRFIRTGFYRPPPMNLIPRLKDITFACKMMRNAFASCCRKRGPHPTSQTRRSTSQLEMNFTEFQTNGTSEARETGSQADGMADSRNSLGSLSLFNQRRSSYISNEEIHTRYDMALRKCVKRYLKTHVLQSDQIGV